MGTRMFARRTFMVNCPVSTDVVFVGLSLPSDSVIHDIKIRCSVVHADLAAGSEMLVAAQVVAYAVEGWILPVMDPDTQVSYDQLWDWLVPKDSDVEVLDLDTGGTDTAPMYEPGEVSLAHVFDVGLLPERVYHRHRILTMARNSLLSYQENQTPFSVLWVPGDAFDIHIKKRLRVRQPSCLVFAIGIPTGDDTLATAPTFLSEAQWPQVKYIDHVLERAMLHTLGLVEAGAETPFEEATALLKTHLDPDVYESEDGIFAIAGDFTISGEAVIDHSVVGDLPKSAISTGR